MESHQALLIDTSCLEISDKSVLAILSEFSKILSSFKVLGWKVVNNIQAINKYQTIQFDVDIIDDSEETTKSIHSIIRPIIGNIFIRAMVYDGKRVNIYSL